MGKATIAGIFVLAAASTGLAQTTSEPADATGPANLCQELVTYIKAPPPDEAAPAAAAPKEAAKPSPAATSTATTAAEAKDASTGEAGGVQSTSVQEVTNQTGPATDAPNPDVPADKVGSVQDAPQQNTMSAPVPTDGESAPKLAVVSVEEAEQLAAANDIAACQSAFKELRLAGVAVPPPLLALAALDLQYQSTAMPQAQAGTGAAPPAGAESTQTATGTAPQGGNETAAQTETEPAPRTTQTAPQAGTEAPQPGTDAAPQQQTD